jgi:hypothetical protein
MEYPPTINSRVCPVESEVVTSVATFRNWKGLHINSWLSSSAGLRVVCAFPDIEIHTVPIFFVSAAPSFNQPQQYGERVERVVDDG